MEEIQYSAGMVSRPFWFMETKKTAKLMTSCQDKDFLRGELIISNAYQAPSEERAIQIFNTVYRRLMSLPIELRESIASTDAATAKIIVLFSIMKTDRLFFEFMYEVFREKLIIGDFNLKDWEINKFLDDKKTQSATIQKWSDHSMAKLKQCYSRMLFDSGLTSGISEERIITPVCLDYRVRKLIENNGMVDFLNSVTGEN